MARIICSIALLVWTAGSFAQDLTPWQLIHPNSKALIGIQWSAVKNSEVGPWLRERWIGDLQIPGVDFNKDVQQILISSPGNAGAGEPPLLIAVRGVFDQKHVETALTDEGMVKQMFSGASLFRPKARGSTDPAFALLSDHLILIGDPTSLFSTIERSRLPRPDELGSFLQKAQSLDARYDCWALLSDSGAMQNFMLASLFGKNLTERTQSFEAGISVRDGLAIDLTMTTQDERAAQTLQTNLRSQVRLAAQDPRAWAGKFQVSTDKANVIMSLRMLTSQVQHAVAAKPQVIRIEGLDDGPRFVPFKP